MHLVMKSRGGIWCRIFSIRKVFALCRINRTAAERLSRKTLVKVFSQQELTRFRIAHKNSLLVVRLGVLDVGHQVSIARSCFFCEIAAESVNKIVCVNWIAVGPATVCPQVESELG